MLIVIPIIIVIIIPPIMFVVFMLLVFFIIVCDDVFGDGHSMNNNVHANNYYDNLPCHRKDCNIPIPALYLSLSKHDPSRAYGNVYNNHIHHACACQMFWLFQGPNLHSPNLFHIAYNNHPIDCWGLLYSIHKRFR